MTGSMEAYEIDERVDISVTVNSKLVQAKVPARMLLSDFLRHELELTGTHVGCEHGVCGACTVHIDGLPARSCLTLAPQVDGCVVRTIEGLADDQGRLHPVQQAFADCHALQCGFCTPGFIMAVVGIVEEKPDLSTDDAEIRSHIAGNLCRCTGYQNIVEAVRASLTLTREEV